MSSVPAIVTYRLSDKHMAYVTPAENYEQAIEFAYNVFPKELASVAPTEISFSISVIVGQRHASAVNIGRMAWSSVMKTLSQFEIIDVVINKDSTETSDSPPRYASSLPPTDEKSLYAASAANRTTTSLRSHPPCHRTPSRGRGRSSDRDKSAARRWIERIL